MNLSETISEEDSLIFGVEELINEPKVAVEIEGAGRRHNAPNEFILSIKRLHSHSTRLLVVARKSGGRRFISLVSERGEVLRQYHYDYKGHGNPNSTSVGKSHKHFPTEKYPLRKSHKEIDTWAYDPGVYPDDFVGAVKHFCEECNISIEGLQERLPLRWWR